MDSLVPSRLRPRCRPRLPCRLALGANRGEHLDGIEMNNYARELDRAARIAVQPADGGEEGAGPSGAGGLLGRITVQHSKGARR